MAQKGISTQEETTGLQNELSKLASNLIFHINSSLGKAHGIELIYGYIDQWGNDLRVYLDDKGGLVSHGNTALPNFVRFVINGVAYYAPCLLPPYGGSDPGGQSTVTSITTSLTSPSSGQEVALITDYAELDTAAAAGMENYIIEHSRQTHQIAHSELVVVPIQTFRSNGALIGNFRVRIPVSGFVYEIPCDTCIGGPLRPHVVVTVLPMGLVATPGAITHDPPDVNVLFVGLPYTSYTATIKVRGVVIMKEYTKPGWALPGGLIPCYPVPPAATTPQACFQFTGVLPANGRVKPDNGVIEWKLLVGDPLSPDEVYCLNTGVSVSWPAPLDYTFDLPLTTDSAGEVKLTLTSRTGDGATTGNIGRYKVDDNDPPLLASIQAIQATKYVWMQVDVISAI